MEATRDVVGPKVADAVVEQGQHAVCLKRQDVDAGMKLTLEAQKWQQPPRLDLLAGIPVDHERRVVPIVYLNITGAVGKGLPPSAALTGLCRSTPIQFGK